jgi:hypothetical protein
VGCACLRHVYYTQPPPAAMLLLPCHYRNTWHATPTNAVNTALHSKLPTTLHFARRTLNICMAVACYTTTRHGSCWWVGSVPLRALTESNRQQLPCCCYTTRYCDKARPCNSVTAYSTAVLPAANVDKAWQLRMGGLCSPVVTGAPNPTAGSCSAAAVLLGKEVTHATYNY